MFRYSIRPIQLQSNLNIAAGAIFTVVAAYSAYSVAMKPSKEQGSQRTFGRGPAFISLRLESVETLSHDTKRLRFQLPDNDAVSGLGLTCKIFHYSSFNQFLTRAAALLTLCKPQNSIFPVIRPYTPVSDLSKLPQNSKVTPLC